MIPDTTKDTLLDIEKTFADLLESSNVMKDGPLCTSRYNEANLRVMWILKQNIDYGFSDYSEQLKQNLDRVSSSPTWRRLAHASYGLLSGITDYEETKSQERGACIGALLSTAIVNVNKELGGSRSSDESVLEGYSNYRQLVSKQIQAHNPHVIITCMVGTNESLKPVVESIYSAFTGESEYSIQGHSEPNTANVAWSRSGDKSFLWAYHPSYTHVSDMDYFDGIINAYAASKNK